jgi:hypothetical protein
MPLRSVDLQQRGLRQRPNSDQAGRARWRGSQKQDFDIDNGSFTVCRARLALAMISTRPVPGDAFCRLSICVIPRSSDTAISPSSSGLSRVLRTFDLPVGAPCAISQDGDKALEETVARADELAAAGDDNGAATWRRITNAVVQLASTSPSGPVH